MPRNHAPPGDPFPLEDIISATPESVRAFRDQSVILRAGALIRQMREAAGITQREMARRVRTSQPHLSDLERGTGTQGPTVLMLQRIAEACGTTLSFEVSGRRSGRSLAGGSGGEDDL